jgi:NADPH:quinone reductase-like Zn-dependent oxidoreductase
LKPLVTDDGVLIRVRATAVTTADWRMRASAFPRLFWLPGRLWLGLFRPRNPVLGMDFSGVVEATGKNVTRFRPGDEVFGSTSANRRGAHAEYVLVGESDAVVKKPECLTHEEAAAIPFGANCALQFLRDFAGLKSGQRVLVVGASGTVGSWAVQIARHLGAHVTGVCSTGNVGLVHSLGAERVRDYTAGPFLGDSGSYDVVFDTIGVTTFAEVSPALTDTGTFLPLETGVRELLQALFSPRRGKKLKYAVSSNRRDTLEEIVSFIEAGAIRPVVDRVYPMTEIVAAHRRVERRHKRGSVIVSLNGAVAASSSHCPTDPGSPHPHSRSAPPALA